MWCRVEAPPGSVIRAPRTDAGSNAPTPRLPSAGAASSWPCSSFYHLLHLSADYIAPWGSSNSPYVRLVNGFQIWWVVLSYTIALLAVGFHVRHGFWSAFATLGANTSVPRRHYLNQLAVVPLF